MSSSHAPATIAAVLIAICWPSGGLRGAEPPADGIRRLLDAARRDDVAAAKSLLQRGVDPNAGGSHRPLHTAAMRGNVKLIRLLLAHGAKVDAGGGHTPLYMTVTRGHVEAAKTLLEGGANPNARTRHHSVLAHALHRPNHRIEIVKLLLAHGADPRGRGVLRTAAVNDRLEAARLLLKRGADPNSVIYTAALRSNRAMLKLLIEHGGDIDVRGPCSMTALTNLCRGGKINRKRTDTARILLELGADPNEAIHIAVASRLPEMVRLLLDHKADVNAQNSSGNTPLHLVGLGGPATENAKRVILMLLAAGADAGLKDKDGLTVLWRALRWTHPTVPRFLLEAGVEPDVFAALLLDMPKKARELIETDPRRAKSKHPIEGTPLHAAVRRGHGAIVALCLKHGADVNASRRDGYSPLHLAVVKGDKGLVTRLLAAGANVNARTGPGGHFIGGINRSWTGSKTPLHLAAQKGHAALVRLLLARGADVNAREGFAKTALHEAVAHGDLAIVRVLLEKGAKVNLACSCAADEYTFPPLSLFSETPLRIARRLGHKAIEKLLLAHGAREKADKPASRPVIVRPFLLRPAPAPPPRAARNGENPPGERTP